MPKPSLKGTEVNGEKLPGPRDSSVWRKVSDAIDLQKPRREEFFGLIPREHLSEVLLAGPQQWLETAVRRQTAWGEG